MKKSYALKGSIALVYDLSYILNMLLIIAAYT